MMKFLRRIFARGEYFAAPIVFVGRAPWWRGPVLTTLKWRSPDGQATARLEIPKERPDDDFLIVRVDGRSDALHLQPIWLGGVWGYFVTPENAFVDLHNLQRHLRPHHALTLEVGAERTKWQPID